MISVERQFIRPSSDVKFHFFIMTDDIKQYIFNTYVLTQKRLTQQIEISEDLLTASIYEEWESEEALQSFRNDEFLQQFWELRDAYNESVGIVATALDIKQLD